MSNTRAIIREHLDLLEDDRDGVFHALLEMGDEVIPDMIDVFRDEKNVKVRAFLVELVWQNRQQTTIPFLTEALNDPEPMVWEQALDGLVTLASQPALDALRDARKRRFTNDKQRAKFRRWLDEAIEQVGESMKTTRNNGPTPD